MAKDPAVLFYTADFLVGVSGLTMEERGQYITLLCLQHQQGHLSNKDILINVGNVSEDVLAKFEIDEENKRYNIRMEQEAIKRRNFVESRRQASISRFKNSHNQDEHTEHRTTHRTINHTTHRTINHTTHRMGNENININEYIKSIIEYLNSKLGTKYKYTSDYIQTKIKARLNEGFTPEDFYTVIDKKIHEWRGTKLEKFLRPETLFGTKFQEYLNQIGKRDDEYAAPSKPSKPRHGDFDPNEALMRALKRSEGG